MNRYIVEEGQYLVSIILLAMLEDAVLIPMRDIFGVNDPLNKLLSKELYVLLLACSTLSLARQSIFGCYYGYSNHLPLVYPYFIDV